MSYKGALLSEMGGIPALGASPLAYARCASGRSKTCVSSNLGIPRAEIYKFLGALVEIL